MAISSPTTAPPVSISLFHCRPNSLRLTLVVAEAPMMLTPSMDLDGEIARDLQLAVLPVPLGGTEVEGGVLGDVEEVS